MKDIWVEKYRPKTVDEYVFKDEAQNEMPTLYDVNFKHEYTRPIIQSLLNPDNPLYVKDKRWRDVIGFQLKY